MLLPDPARLPDGKQESELAGSELLNPPRAFNSPKNTHAPCRPIWVKIPIPNHATCFCWSERGSRVSDLHLGSRLWDSNTRAKLGKAGCSERGRGAGQARRST